MKYFHPKRLYRHYWTRLLDCYNLLMSIEISNHCWIGRNVYIAKRTILPEGTIVGAYSVVTKRFTEKNTIIAGNPAEIKKLNITWVK